MDEPATSLDEDNMQSFISALEILKLQFKNVIIISHLESLKDIVDQQVIIDSKDGYAKLNYG
jgi:DNA repair exonuclease SbcCD ATPase subunit